MNIRKPAVAGRFYPRDKEKLKKMLTMVYDSQRNQMDNKYYQSALIGAVSPHAGYQFSGYQMVHIFDVLKHMDWRYDIFVILHPDHYGHGNGVFKDVNDYWETPLGEVEIDKEIYDRLDIPASEEAHIKEHSGEVLVPFLQFFMPYEFKIAPLAFSSQTPDEGKYIAEALAKIKSTTNKRIFMLASSDFSHFLSPEQGAAMDTLALTHILNFDPETTYQVIRENGISICGYGPIISLMHYSMNVSQRPVAEVIAHGNSGDVMPSNEVVDYYAILFYEPLTH